MALPEEPYTRVERYLARLSGQNVDIPDYPITRIECYLYYLCGNGGGASPTAGGHNSVFRGANLGSTYTEAQADAIDSGEFTGLFLGDYWEMPWGESQTPTKFRIAGFDLYYGLGNPAFEKHHAVVVPDAPLASAMMNPTETSEGGYKGSYMKTTVLPGILTDLELLFDGILERYSILATGASSVEATLTRLDLMSTMQASGVKYPNSLLVMGEMTTQFPLFAIEGKYSSPAGNYWLQDSSGSSFVVSSKTGSLGGARANNANGVRPYFCLGKVTTP